MEEYNGDVIIINRLKEFFPDDSMEWNSGEKIKLHDIDVAIKNLQSRPIIMFGY